MGANASRIMVKRIKFYAALALFMSVQVGLSAMANNPKRQKNEVLQIESKSLYHQVPDAEIFLPDGQKVYLSTLWKKKPILITLFYNRCTGTCSPFLRSLKSAVEKVGGLGEDYQVVSLSFDPTDTRDEVDALANSLGIQQKNKWWVGTASPENIARISKAIGFWYKWESSSNQFDHPSLVAAVRDGKIIRVLLGSIVDPSRLKEVLWEFKGVFVPFYTQPGKNIIFRCLELDEQSQKIRLSWGLLILFAPGLAAIAVATAIFRKRARSN